MKSVDVKRMLLAQTKGRPLKSVLVPEQMYLFVYMKPRTANEVREVFPMQTLSTLNWYVQSGEMVFENGVYRMTDLGRKLASSRIKNIVPVGALRNHLRELNRKDEVRILDKVIKEVEEPTKSPIAVLDRILCIG